MIASVASIIAIISTIIQGAQTAVQIGRDATPFLALIKKVFSKEQITQAELDDIAAQNDALFAEIQKPLPPEED